MTTYLQPTEELPLDEKHRWLVFASKPGQSTARMQSALRNLGLYAWNIQESSTKVGSSEVAYTTPVEATIAGITPVKIAQRLGVNKLTVTYEPIPWSLEAWIDAQEFIEPSPIPVDFLQGGERLNPGAYYGTLATWFAGAPSMELVTAKLKARGFDVLVDQSMVSATAGNNKFFYIGTKDKNPALEELKNAIQSDALYINKHPFDNARELQALGGAKIALEKGLRDFATSVADAAAAVTELGGGAVETVGTVAKMGRIFLYALPVLLVGGLGYWGYTKFKES